MNRQLNTKVHQEVDFYGLVKNIKPGRSPSIYHGEYPYYWAKFPSLPVYTIYNTEFYKITLLPHCVDCSQYGQVHYSARAGSKYTPALVVAYFLPPNGFVDLRFFSLLVD